MLRNISRGDPNSRLYRDISEYLSLFVLLLCLAACIVAVSTVVRREVRTSVGDAVTFVRQWHRSIGAQLALPLGLTSALASTSVFTAPSDYSEYKRRLEPLDQRTSRGLPEKLVSNARTAGYNRLVRGYLYRGVPLATENGRLLLRNQRRLAGEVATTFQYVDSIAEVDSLGRLVFAEPYAQQQRLTDFDIGRSALFQAVRTNPNQWIVHSSFDGLDRRLLSRATPIVRNRNIDGYLIVSIDAGKAFRPESLNVSLPSELADLSTEFELPEGGGRTLIQVGGGDLGLVQRILSVAPRRLIDWLYPVQLRRLDSIGQLTCLSRMQGDPFGVLRCQESLRNALIELESPNMCADPACQLLVTGGLGVGVLPVRETERMMKLQDVILKAMAKTLTWIEAAEIAGMSVRNMQRMRQRYQEGGYSGLFDQRRGKRSIHRIPMETAEQVLALSSHLARNCSAG